MVKAGIYGVSGYAGAQLLWLLLNHKEVEVKFIAAYSSAGKEITELYGNYRKVFEEKCVSFEEANAQIDNIDVLFTA
ncbi:MAG: N-acetyl-gamma-glutamyl-phosphate reductase, partial [Fusobacteriaceae bacterium]|nr:N-acetyl-gamma-glutamyl-phosphate reductase [Fusobacteriaceae bacterium]